MIRANDGGYQNRHLIAQDFKNRPIWLSMDTQSANGLNHSFDDISDCLNGLDNAEIWVGFVVIHIEFLSRMRTNHRMVFRKHFFCQPCGYRINREGILNDSGAVIRRMSVPIVDMQKPIIFSCIFYWSSSKRQVWCFCRFKFPLCPVLYISLKPA